MKNNECLAQITGSCRGCDIATMAKDKIRQGAPLEETVERIQTELCPEGLQMDKDIVKKERLPTWGTL